MPSKQKRQKIWRHNSFLGHAAMMRQNARNIITADTPTDEAKDLAAQIESLAARLSEALKERVDANS